MSIEKETEEKIFEAAQRVFQKRGFDGARMQDIADEADINKSMLHYYYRSKDKLFMKVFQAGAKKIIPKLFGILGSDVVLEEKVKRIVDFYYDTFKDNQQLPAFFINEMNQNSERFEEFITGMDLHLPEVFIDQVYKKVNTGEMIEITPDQFLMNVISMCMMPIVAKIMVQNIFHLNEDDYMAFLEERRRILPKIILNGVKPS